MRGSALRASGGAEISGAPRVLAGDFQPRAPRPRGALPLVGLPASERFASDSTDRRVRPLGTRTQGALLPETPARKEQSPFLHQPRYRRKVPP